MKSSIALWVYALAGLTGCSEPSLRDARSTSRYGEASRALSDVEAQTASLEPQAPPTVEEARASIAQPPCRVGVDRWGVGDEAGQSNTQTPRKMLQAVRLIGPHSRTFLLGHRYEEGMPHFPFPTLVGYNLDIPDGTHRVAVPPVVLHEELVYSEIGQVGTQLDGLGHMCFMDPGSINPEEARCYGGYSEGQIYHPKGLRKLGVEKLKPYFTRGILLDVARHLNANQRLAPGTVVTLEMIVATLAAQDLSISDIQEGDVVLVRTGHEELWDRPDLGTYYGDTPGIDLEVARFFASRCVGNVGADNWPVEVSPPVDPGLAPVHEFNLTVAGIPQQENLALRGLSEHLAGLRVRDRYLFAFIYIPVAMRGATGSPGAPMAIR